MTITMRLLPLILAATMQQTPAPAPAAPAPGGRGGQPATPQFTSPDVSADKRVTFRVYAPDAATVALRGSDIPAPARTNIEFTKGANGVWEMTTGPVEPGAYRYVYVVNGVGVIDPRNTAISESNTTTWSVAVVRSEERRVGRGRGSGWVSER